FDYALEGLTQDDELGYALSRIGDYDQDGCDDFVVGAYYGHSFDGEALIFSGKTGSQIARIHGKGGAFGAAVDGKLDVDGDGFTEILVGEPYFSTGAAI